MSVESATLHHPHARAVLGAAAGSGQQASHAYLFHGPPGAGKAEAARQFAASLLAEGAADEAEARRRACAGVHPDLTWVTPSGAAEMLRSDVDEPVVAAAARTPFESRRRVFVIERADTLNDQAANRLLKTLEEPPAYVHLILLCGRPSDVLPTIRSRCIAVRFEALKAGQLAQQLTQEEGVAADMALSSARLARGDARQARILTTGSGRELRQAAERFVRSAIRGDSADRAWLDLLAQSRTAGQEAHDATAARVAARADSLPARDAKRMQRDGESAARRAQRRAASAAIDQSMHLSALWLRDLVALANGAEAALCHCDRIAELREDHGLGLETVALGDAALAVEEARTTLVVNPTEELALEALSLRISRLLS